MGQTGRISAQFSILFAIPIWLSGPHTCWAYKEGAWQLYLTLAYPILKIKNVLATFIFMLDLRSTQVPNTQIYFSWANSIKENS